MMENLCLKVEENLEIPTTYLPPLLQVQTGNANWPRTQTFQKLNAFFFSTRILQTIKSFLSCIQNRLIPGYCTCKKGNEKQNIQCEYKAYHESNETNSIIFSDGFLTFTKHLIYLGSSLSYNLHSDCDVDRRLASSSSSMLALNNFCK